MNSKTSWIIGADPSCDLVVDIPSVSRRHCRLSRGPAGAFLILDLGSTNGTYVNGQKISTEVNVSRVDSVTLGFSVPMPWPDAADDPSLSAPSVEKVVRVGREPDNDFVIDRPEVSGHHARVVVAPGGRQGYVEDLGSTNGTAVNVQGQRASRVPIAPGDVLYFGPVAVSADTFLGRQQQGAGPVGVAPVMPPAPIPTRSFEPSLSPGAPTASDPLLPSYAILIGLALGVQSIVLAGLVHALKHWSTASSLFALGMASLWVGVSAAFFERFLARTFAGNRRLDDPTLGGLVLSILRAALVTLPFALVLMGLVPTSVPGAGRWPAAFGVIGLTALVGAALGLAVARVAGGLAWGIPAAAVVCLVVGLLSAPVGATSDRAPVSRLVASAMPTRWCFEALCLLSAGENADDPATDPVAPYFPAETDRSGLLACVSALLAMLGGLLYADAVMALSRPDRPSPAGPASR